MLHLQFWSVKLVSEFLFLMVLGILLLLAKPKKIVVRCVGACNLCRIHHCSEVCGCFQFM